MKALLHFLVVLIDIELLLHEKEQQTTLASACIAPVGLSATLTLNHGHESANIRSTMLHPVFDVFLAVAVWP